MSGRGDGRCSGLIEGCRQGGEQVAKAIEFVGTPNAVALGVTVD